MYVLMLSTFYIIVTSTPLQVMPTNLQLINPPTHLAAEYSNLAACDAAAAKHIAAMADKVKPYTLTYVYTCNKKTYP